MFQLISKDETSNIIIEADSIERCWEILISARKISSSSELKGSWTMVYLHTKNLSPLLERAKVRSLYLDSSPDLK